MIDQVHSPVDNSTIGVDINISAWDLIGKTSRLSYNFMPSSID
jgi:hypothetical protein